jgi:hypothetical protein
VGFDALVDALDVAEPVFAVKFVLDAVLALGLGPWVWVVIWSRSLMSFFLAKVYAGQSARRNIIIASIG